MRYLFLQHPGHNRVYYNSAAKLALAELKIACKCLSGTFDEPEISEIAGVRYLSIETDKLLSEGDMRLLSHLSFLFAIFRIDEIHGETCLIPVKRADIEFLDSKINTLLKYQGKTNELFTRMMMNVSLLASDFDYTDQIQMLDPVAGKGTTLFEGAVYGFDVDGIEIESKFVHDTAVFFKKYLEAERFKHSSAKRQIYGANKSTAVHIQEFTYARSKQALKSGEGSKSLGLICGNSRDAAKYFKGERFHLIVGDLPYGIVHGNTSEKGAGSATRNPSELLDDCLPGWHRVLKKGGVVAVSWNAFVASRKKLTELFSSHGFEVETQAPYDEFEHMVDKSIKRDIIVAKKGEE